MLGRNDRAPPSSSAIRLGVKLAFECVCLAAVWSSHLPACRPSDERYRCQQIHRGPIERGLQERRNSSRRGPRAFPVPAWNQVVLLSDAGTAHRPLHNLSGLWSVYPHPSPKIAAAWKYQFQGVRGINPSGHVDPCRCGTV